MTDKFIVARLFHKLEYQSYLAFFHSSCVNKKPKLSNFQVVSQFNQVLISVMVVFKNKVNYLDIRRLPILKLNRNEYWVFNKLVKYIETQL